MACIGCTPSLAAVKAAQDALPLEFEQNRGQFSPEVLYLARCSSHFVYLTRSGMTVGINDSSQSGGAVEMRIENGNPAAQVQPENSLPGVSQYFLGNDPHRWHRDVPHYGRIRYIGVWKGIDLVFRGNGQELEYDFVVSPGADPSGIRLSYPNARNLRTDSQGRLVIETASGRLTERLPAIYQESKAGRSGVAGGFRISGNREVRFAVGAYDRRRPLVIDPAVTFSTYIGGTGTLTVSALAVDSGGNSYIAGTVSSPDFPLVNPVKQVSGNAGLYRSTDQGNTWSAPNSTVGKSSVLSLAADPAAPTVAYAGTSKGVFKTADGGTWAAANTGIPASAAVTSIAVDPLAHATIYACTTAGLYKSTDAAASWKLIAGSGGPTLVAVDSKNEGTIWLGYTFGIPIVSFDGGATFFSANLPEIQTTALAIDPSNSNTVYFAETSGGLLKTNDGGLSYSRISSGLAANGSTASVNTIAVDKNNPSRILVGTNTGAYYSVTAGSNFQSSQGIGNRKVISIIFDPRNDANALAGTAGGGVYVSGDGGQTWTPTGPANLDVNALAMSSDEQITFAGLYSSTNAFLTKIDPTGTSILYSSYLGGTGRSDGAGVAVDSSGHAFLCGGTDASDFPLQNAYQRYVAGIDMFVTRFNSSGGLDASTLLGGHADDSCNALAIDRSGNVLLAGTTTLITGGRSDFPATTGTYGSSTFGNEDCIVAKFDNTLQSLLFATFLGGSDSEACYAIAADAAGNSYVAGATFSANFPVTHPPFGGSRAGGNTKTYPSFLSKLSADGSTLIYSGLVGGSNGFTQLAGVAVNAAGRAYIAGVTEASDYPLTSDALSSTFQAPSKGVLGVVEADGSKFVYSTYLPGAKGSFANRLALDTNGNVWVTGVDYGGLPATADAIPHAAPPVNTLAPFVDEVDVTNSKLLYSSYLAGSAGGSAADVAAGANGSVYLTGTTQSTDFPLTGTPFKQASAVDYAAYLIRLSPSAGGGPTAPLITSVQNGASFQNGFTPGAWMTIKGSNLSTITDTWEKFIVNGQLPTSLDGVKVTIGGQPAYIYFVSSGQINAVVPNIAAGAVDVVVTNSQGTSVPFSATVQAVQPAFFLWNNTYAVATRQDFSYAAKDGTFAGLTTVAATPGDVIILWGTGFGPTTPPAPAGQQIPASAFLTANPVTVTIGGQPATVFGAALAPGFAALYQVAIQIPASLADGDYSVVATVAGQASPATALISVQH